MKKTTIIRILSFMSAALIAVCGMYLKERAAAQNYRLRLQNEYSRALSELDSRLNNISLILSKSVYVTAQKHISDYASELFSEAELAKDALSRLPVDESGLDTVNRFLSQVGNFALSVSKSLITGNKISDEQKKNLEILGNTASTVSKAVSNSQISFNNSDYWSLELSGTQQEASLADNLTELEQNLTDYPTLVYDGPYSDHIITKKPLMIQNAETVPKDTALNTAEKLISNSSKLEFDGEENGTIECYRFSNKEVSATISKKGGYPVYMRKNRVVKESSFSYSQALLKAKDFLKKNGFSKMTDTYYFNTEGICVISFAFLDGQTVCYTDLIKVGVALDNGEIMLLETKGYLTNHTDRFFETPVYTSEQAKATLSSGLNVEQAQITLIPTDAGGQVRCYEFLCLTEKKEEMLIYINTQTCESEQIFILLKTDGGTLVR